MASNTYAAVGIEKAFIFDGDELKLSTDAKDYVVDDELIKALEEADELEREQVAFEAELEGGEQ